MIDPSSSWQHIENMSQYDPSVKNILRRLTVRTYSEFIEILYDDIQAVLERVEGSAQLFENESEDATTQRILDVLHGMTYHASHNSQYGGNVDLTIELLPQRFRWIGEAKKFNDVGDMREGYLQLATRYKPGAGAINAVYGGLIGYLRRPNAVACMDGWKVHYQEAVEKASVLTPCRRRGSLAFISETTHASLGLPFHVWHLCVSLHFAPLDKSARSAAKYKV